MARGYPALALLAIAVAFPASAQSFGVGDSRFLLLIGLALVVLLASNLIYFITREKSGEGSADDIKVQAINQKGAASDEVLFSSGPRREGLVLHGFDTGGQAVHFQFESDELATGVIVGRGSEARARLDDDRVGRRHAELRMTGERIEVRDLNSTNKTFINGTEVPPNGVAQAKLGDNLRFGPVTLSLKKL